MMDAAGRPGLLADEGGSTVIEMALIVPLIVLMLVGMMVLGAGYITDSRLSRLVAAATAAWMDAALEHGPGRPLPKSFDGYPICSALLGYDVQNDPMVFAAGNSDCALPKGPDIFLDQGEAELMMWATGPVFGFGGYHEKTVVWRVTIPGFDNVKSGNLEQRGSPSVTAHKYVYFTGGGDGGAMNPAYAPNAAKGGGNGSGNGGGSAAMAMNEDSYQMASAAVGAAAAPVPTSVETGSSTPQTGSAGGTSSGSSKGNGNGKGKKS